MAEHYGNTPLWFDVGIKRYTTESPFFDEGDGLWFDVGIGGVN